MALPTVHSESLRADLPLGLVTKTPEPNSFFAHPTKVAFADVLRTIPSSQLPPVPENFGHGLAFGSTGWGMDGNGPQQASNSKIAPTWAAAKGCGDCFWAGSAHDIRLKAQASGRPIPSISDLTTVQNYARAEKYNPQTGANDNGTDPTQGLAWRQSEGFSDDAGVVHSIGTILELTPGNLDELFYTAWLCEAAGVGFNFQQAQMDQFDAGQSWSYVKGSPIEGGHWIIVTSRNGLITWGTREGYLDSWYTNLCSCAYGWYDLLEYNAVTGETAEHFDDTDVEKYMTLVAAAKAKLLGLL